MHQKKMWMVKNECTNWEMWNFVFYFILRSTCKSEEFIFFILRPFATVLQPNSFCLSITLLINFSPNKCSLLYYRYQYISLFGLVGYQFNMHQGKTKSSPQLLIQLLLLLLHLYIIQPFRNKCCHDTITMVLITKKG